MSYAPKQIMVTSLFLATKTESMHLSVRKFVSWLTPIKGLSALTTDDVLAPEYILTQGLRFCFDVRHPLRALKGAFIELQLLLAIARGDRPPESWVEAGRTEATTGKKDTKGGWDVQAALSGKFGPPMKFAARIEKAYQRARETLHKDALISDAYFLFTPSQIMFAALMLADRDLAGELLRIRVTMPPPGPVLGDSQPVRPALAPIMAEIERCVGVLKTVRTEEMKDEARRISKKLEGCKNPDKVDLVSLNKAQKRDAAEDGMLDEKLVKKRKLERENAEKEGEELFGPTLTKPLPD
jgi:cyclin H